MASPILFRSTDSGAPTLSGTAGDLLTVLNACLTLLKMFTAVSGAAFVDNTNKARSQSTAANAGTFLLFQGPTVSDDEAYFGLAARFDRVKIKFATSGVQNAAVTLAWEYWNGSAWTALSVSDGTSELTADGTVTWTIPGDWVTKAVNSVTCFWLRLRFTAGSWTTNPLVQYSTITGWTQAYGPTSNEIAYQQGGGNGFFLDVEDNSTSNTQGGAGAPTARDARVYGYETMSAVKTGTQMVPASGTISVWRKSTAADATTRTWMVMADDRTVIVAVQSGDSAGNYVFGYAGDYYSLVPNDPYRFCVIADVAETAGTLAAGNALMGVLATTIAAQTGKYSIRSYLGFGPPAALCLMNDIKGGGAGWLGLMQFPNGADGGLWLSPIWVCETTPVMVRGRLRGLSCPLHAVANFTDGDTFSGGGSYAGKTFVAGKGIFGSAAGVAVLETSDTWETN